MSEVVKNAIQASKSGVDFKEQLQSALSVKNDVLETVFSSKSEYANLVLRRMLNADAYRRNKMDIHSRWYKLCAAAEYKKRLEKFGADGFGALERCRDMLLKLVEKFPGDGTLVVGQDDCLQALRNCLDQNGRLVHIDYQQLVYLGSAYLLVMDSLFPETVRHYIESCVRARLEAILMREKGLSEQAELKVQTADFSLAKAIKNPNELPKAQQWINVVLTDIVDLSLEIVRIDYKQFIIVCQNSTLHYYWFTDTVSWFVKSRYPTTFRTADERLRKESIRYRWFGVVKDDIRLNDG